MLPFIPGYAVTRAPLLARFLPPLAEGVAAHYIEQCTHPGEVVLDPFGQAPTLIREALTLGRRVIVANFNPISRLVLELAVQPPSLPALQAALAALAEAPIAGGQRLEPYLHSLYATTCAECQSPVVADAFEWETDALLVEKHYFCRTCAASRHSPPNEDDLRRARRCTHTGPDYHDLLNRVTPPDDPERSHAEEVLRAYPARALTAIATTLRRAEALPNRVDRRAVQGLTLAALNTTLPLAQERPKLLAPPRRYVEVNFWRALEKALGMLAGPPESALTMPLADLLADNHRAGLYIHAGPMRDLALALPNGCSSLALAAFPRPTQAYWMLSAVWAAWLWGHAAADPLRALLKRRRYDWAWHTEGLSRLLKAAKPAVNGPLVALLSEAEPAFVTSAITAAQSAGFAAPRAALQSDTAEAQIIWSVSDPSPPPQTPIHAALDALYSRAEPARYGLLHLAAQCAAPDAPITLKPGPELTRLDADADAEPTSGWWWANTVPPADPLADRIEQAVAARLAAGPIDEHHLLRDLCAAFPGPQTPERDYVLACLNSYAMRGKGGNWELRPEDAADRRGDEVAVLLAELRALGGREGFRISGHQPQVWHDGPQAVYRFIVTANAAISRYLLAGPSGKRTFIVFPGGRAGLLEHKLRHDPRLRAALQSGHWQLLKFRLIRQMFANATLTRKTLAITIDDDPLEGGKQLVLV